MTKKIIYITVSVGLLALFFWVGYQTGKTTPDWQIRQQDQQKQSSTDLVTINGKYSVLYNLCEQKYQTALKGDYPGAQRINGEMDVVQQDIKDLQSKYNSPPK